jgi:hypothetical protein
MPHHYETWLYSLNGSRKKLYHGKSPAAARKARDAAVLVLQEFRLNASIIIAECNEFGLFQVEYQTDYFNGWQNPREEKRELILALDVRSRCFLCNGTGEQCEVCGEAEAACTCDGGPTLGPCSDCDGSGK